MAEEKVLLVDDDESVQEIQKLYLEREGFHLLFAGDGPSAIRLAEEHKPDLIILDVSLPGIDGFEVCQILRKTTKAPILFLSAREDDFEQILGHRIGGDDYITKPFSPRLLVAKVKAHLRRYRDQEEAQSNILRNSVISFKDLEIEKESCVVKKKGKPVTLSTKEFLLLCFLAENPNRVYSVEQIFDVIWGEDSLGDYRTVMVHISNLRKKIEIDPAKPMYISTVRGLGYKFNVS
ncbi:response regulator transcription factor [Peribacillus cavernae]|uniref:Response regulator transcription factor n=1 Tax=Peribacillus cavernae TaxID=1674310 RepID=A0A433HP61_9BACI|nr:response regulator transcription factor [Peribacillus cavernae]MDQ0217448.1 DNA-binding response OmpR family regulator [Peribacillus cavernae]RUQ30108.1 response regulator transcription factor [Peribacillus cavernae]